MRATKDQVRKEQKAANLAAVKHGNRQYRRGANRERDTITLLESQGAVAWRTPGSKGAADVIALRKGSPPLLVQVKCGKNPYGGFGPGERKKLIDMAKRAGASAVLCHWPPRSDPKWIPPEEWPDAKAA